MDEDNRRRAFGPVASLDAWHEGFTASRRKAKLFVDVAFSEARIGGGPDDDVRFRLRLKRAEVVVTVGPFEKVGVDRASVSRDAPSVSGKRVETRRTRSRLASEGSLETSAAPAGVSVRGRGKLSGRAERDRDEAIKLVQDVSAFSVLQVETEAGEYAWVVKPALAGTLEGRPWNVKTSPRLSIVDLRGDDLRLDPGVNVEIRCRREDLEILGISPTRKRDLGAMAKDPLWTNKVKAAEAIIRTRLARAGLLRGDIEDPYAQIVLCATLATGP